MIFVNQGHLTIILETRVELTSALSTSILYKKPDGTSGTWSPTEILNKTQISYSVTDTDIDQIGVWTIQAKVVFNTGNTFGIPVKFRAYNHL